MLVVPDGKGETGILVQIPVRLSQTQGDGSGLAGTHRASIYRRDRDNTARRASKKYLVRRSHFVGWYFPSFEWNSG